MSRGVCIILECSKKLANVVISGLVPETENCTFSSCVSSTNTGFISSLGSKPDSSCIIQMSFHLGYIENLMLK